MRTSLEEQRIARFETDSTRQSDQRPFYPHRFRQRHDSIEWRQDRTGVPPQPETGRMLPGGQPIRPGDARPRGFESHPKMEPAFFNNLAMALNLIWVGLFYLNACLLIPRLVYRKKVVLYILVQVLVFLLVALAAAAFLKYHLHEPSFRLPMPLLMNIFPFLFVQACSMAYRLIADKLREEKLGKEKENEGLKTELSFLRSQISPHFIFNVLNNMVSLARKKSDLLEPSLLRLSGLMRYMLYESDETRVLLSREIEYLQSYIELQSLRFGSDVDLKVDLDTPDRDYFIEPMLLIPFVENAFKHSASCMNKPLIEVVLRVQDGVLRFKVNNHFEPGIENNADRTSGIGLQNVRRRLNLLYGSNHSLLVTEKDGIYSISLQIILA